MIVPVILSGGSGTRLWPLSRESHPKPFIKLPDGESLLQKTYLRASLIPNVTELLTITNESYYLKTKPEYEKVGRQTQKPRASFLLEPLSRNTAASVLVSALKVLDAYGPEAILLVLPADHLIKDTEKFIASCQSAIAIAKQNKLVTFGISPTTPATGFGYIELGDALPFTSAFAVKKFVEKPALSVAKEYVASKNFLWNAGIFCFQAKTVIDEFGKYAPQLLSAAKACLQSIKKNNYDSTVFNLELETFSKLESISIDNALMEKSNAIAVVYCDFDWHDIGSWAAFKNIYPQDENGNTIVGDALLVNSKNNFIQSDSQRMLTTIGVKDLVIVDTPDALLISDKDQTQDVKQIVDALKKQNHESYLTHKTVMRPWGSFTVLEETASFKIKRIVVHPGAALSLQSHKCRSEHWVIVAGSATITNGDAIINLNRDQSTFIPKGNRHRISNPDKIDLVFIEVQIGDYLGEDDIIRYEDNYGRVTQ